MERIDTLRGFLEATPNDPFLQHALALEFVKLGDDVEARKIFENILKNKPDYVGSYYHLAKLLERTGENDLAIEWYEKGMQAARANSDNHALNELRSAYDELAE